MKATAAHNLANALESPKSAPIPEWITPALLADTLRVWQPHYAQPLTEADALAIVMNVSGLLDALENAA